jgi:biotin carboxyl carrier protein
MFERETILRRFVARLRAILDDDWLAKAGSAFRRGVSAISDVNDEYLHVEDKVAETPELAWRAVQGLAGEKHAKAVADYARAENEKIDLALKSRVMEDKVRQERASADKLEAEAALAKLNELKARAELAMALQDLGVTLTVNSTGIINVRKSERLNESELRGIFTLPEKRLLNMIVEVTVPSLPAGDVRVADTTLTKWLCKVGQSVREGDPICEISSNVVDSDVPSPVSGVILDILVQPGTGVEPEKTVVCLIEKR